MMKTPPTFETKRLILKAITVEDIPSYTEYFVDDEVLQYLSDAVPYPYPEGGVEYYLNNVLWPGQGQDRWSWGIFLKENPTELIGCIELYLKGKPENRAFWLGKKFWGQGIMTEAVEPIIDFGFEVISDELIFANAKENIGSARVKEKTGCTYYKTVPAKFINPDITETELWRLKKSDWQLFKTGKETNFTQTRGEIQ